MLQKIPAALAGLIIATISAGGYLGIVGLMAIESACIPIPSEIIMPFSGYLVSTGRFDLLLVATAGAVGCNRRIDACLFRWPLWRPAAHRKMGSLHPDEPPRSRYHGPVLRPFRGHSGSARPAIAGRADVYRATRRHRSSAATAGFRSTPSSARGRGASPSPISDTSWASAGTAIRGCKPSCIAWTCSSWRSSCSRCAGMCGGTSAAAEKTELEKLGDALAMGTGSSCVLRG